MRPAPKRARDNAPISMQLARPSSTISAISSPMGDECMKPPPMMRTFVVALTPGCASRGSRGQPLAHGIVDHAHEGGDVEDRQAGRRLDVRAVWRHVGALEDDGS